MVTYKYGSHNDLLIISVEPYVHCVMKDFGKIFKRLLLTSEQMKSPSLRVSLSAPTDFLVKHNKKGQYYVNPYVISSVSEWFRDKFFEEKITELEVKDLATEKVFDTFIQLLHSKPVDFAISDAFALLRLANTWKVEVLIKQLENLIKEEPDAQVKVATMIDNYSITKKLPLAKNFKKEELISILELESSHAIPHILLMNLLSIAKKKEIPTDLLNKFILKHIELDKDTATEIAQYLDVPALTDEQLEVLLSTAGTSSLKSVMDEKTKRAKNKIIVKPKEEPKVKKEQKTGPFLRVSPPYYGIFASFATKTKKNPVIDGNISVRASSNDPMCFIDKTRKDFCFEIEGVNPSLMVQLPYSIPIKAYEITIFSNPAPRQFVLYGSNNGKTWTLIDKQKDLETIYQPETVIKFELEEVSKPFAYYLLKKKKKCSKTCLSIRYLEIFSEEFPSGVFRSMLNQGENILVSSSSNNLKRILSPRHQAFWYSMNGSSQYVEFFFPKSILRLSSYSIKSGEYWFLKSWELYGSMDGNKWNLLDKRTGISKLNAKFALGMWHTKFIYDSKFIRLIQVDKTYDGMNILCLSGMELFGDIRDDDLSSKQIMTLSLRKKSPPRKPSPKKEKTVPIKKEIFIHSKPKVIKSESDSSDSEVFHDSPKKTFPKPAIPLLPLQSDNKKKKITPSDSSSSSMARIALQKSQQSFNSSSSSLSEKKKDKDDNIPVKNRTNDVQVSKAESSTSSKEKTPKEKETKKLSSSSSSSKAEVNLALSDKDEPKPKSSSASFEFTFNSSSSTKDDKSSFSSVSSETDKELNSVHTLVKPVVPVEQPKTEENIKSDSEHNQPKVEMKPVNESKNQSSDDNDKKVIKEEIISNDISTKPEPDVKSTEETNEKEKAQVMKQEEPDSKQDHGPIQTNQTKEENEQKTPETKEPNESPEKEDKQEITVQQEIVVKEPVEANNEEKKVEKQEEASSKQDNEPIPDNETKNEIEENKPTETKEPQIKNENKQEIIVQQEIKVKEQVEAINDEKKIEKDEKQKESEKQEQNEVELTKKPEDKKEEETAQTAETKSDAKEENKIELSVKSEEEKPVVIPQPDIDAIFGIDSKEEEKPARPKIGRLLGRSVMSQEPPKQSEEVKKQDEVSESKEKEPENIEQTEKKTENEAITPKEEKIVSSSSSTSIMSISSSGSSKTKENEETKPKEEKKDEEIKTETKSKDVDISQLNQREIENRDREDDKTDIKHEEAEEEVKNVEEKSVEVENKIEEKADENENKEDKKEIKQAPRARMLGLFQKPATDNESKQEPLVSLMSGIANTLVGEEEKPKEEPAPTNNKKENKPDKHEEQEKAPLTRMLGNIASKLTKEEDDENANKKEEENKNEIETKANEKPKLDNEDKVDLETVPKEDKENNQPNILEEKPKEGESKGSEQKHKVESKEDDSKPKEEEIHKLNESKSIKDNEEKMQNEVETKDNKESKDKPKDDNLKTKEEKIHKEVESKENKESENKPKEEKSNETHNEDESNANKEVKEENKEAKVNDQKEKEGKKDSLSDEFIELSSSSSSENEKNEKKDSDSMILDFASTSPSSSTDFEKVESDSDIVDILSD